MFCKDFLYICWTWLPALEHGKIEENTVNSGIFNGWGDKGIGSIVEHDVLDRFSGDKSVKHGALIPQKRFRTETRPQKRFRTETCIRWCFRHFSKIFGRLSPRGYWNGILGQFGSFPAREKRPKMKKTWYIARFCSVFGCQSIENTPKTSVLDWRCSKKRVNYRMLDWKHYKNTVKSNVLEGFTAFMAKNV